MDGPKGGHTDWSKSEREEQISYINVFMWNLKKIEVISNTNITECYEGFTLKKSYRSPGKLKAKNSAL